MSDLLSKIAPVSSCGSTSLVKRSLEAIRAHLGMDVAYLSEIVGDESVFREVDAPGLEHLAAVGNVRSLEDVYCRHILEGRLPELMPDTSAFPLAVSMPITQAVPIGAHVSVPIRRPGGELYGMFCCLSAESRPSLNERDLHIVRAFAGLVAEEIERDAATTEGHAAKRAAVKGAMLPGGMAIHLQPICDLVDGRPRGYEALSRFAGPNARTPDRWFADAADVGLGVELECAAIAAAVRLLPLLPADTTLSLNASPTTVVSGALDALFNVAEPERLVLEVTEHADVGDYDELCRHLERLRARGVRLAVDDAGAGFSGLQHILKLQPDSIKLDMALIRGIDVDPARRALASAMQSFARQTGAMLVAEGVETAAERKTLIALGFMRGQGYLLGRPAPGAEVAAAEMAARAA
jgi:EAL domain-containing protein (putative c-di-GMP-specific phosphodiesterase class I)